MRRSKSGIIAGAILGNAFEWYDFAIFSFMTPIVAELFFERGTKDGLSAILLSTALFGVGFIARPIGGIVLGAYADRHGRSRAMVLGMAIMAVGVIMMVSAPTYAQAGSLGCYVIAMARLLQGFSVGGEFATSTTLLVNMAPAHRRGYFGSWQITGQVLAQTIGAAVGYCVIRFFSHQEIIEFAWRLPFAVGLIIIPFILILRRKSFKSNAQDRSAAEASVGLHSVVAGIFGQKMSIAIAMGLVTASTVSFYIIYGYVVTYSTHVLHLPTGRSYLVQLAAAVTMLVVVPVSGFVSDYVDRKKAVLLTLVIYFLAIAPLYQWLTHGPTIEKLICVQIILSTISGAFLGAYCTLVTQILTPETRTTALAIASNLTVMIVGGSSQYVVTWLIKNANSLMAPAYFVMIGVGLGIVAAIVLNLSKINETYDNASASGGDLGNDAMPRDAAIGRGLTSPSAS